MIHTLIPLLALASAIESPDLRHRWTPAELTAACEAAEVDTNKRLATLVAVPDDKRTFADSFVAFDNAVAEYGNTVWRLSFMKDIHTDAAVRDAASACDERAGKFLVNLYARKDLYQALKAFVAGAGKTVRLDAEAGRLLELTLTDFKRSGLELKDKDREKLVALRSRITELQTRFQKNLNDDKTSFDIAATALVGLPQAFIDASFDGNEIHESWWS